MALKKAMDALKGRARLGMQAYADGMLVIPKVLAQNAGYDPQDVMVTLISESGDSGQAVGKNLYVNSLKPFFTEN